MSIPVGLWSLAVAPGQEPEVVSPPADLKITNVALGEKLADEKGRTTIKLSYASIPDDGSDEDDDEEDEEKQPAVNLVSTVITSLTPGKIEQSTVDITLFKDEDYVIEAVGKNTIYLTGYYVDQTGPDMDMSDMSDMESEDDFDLREVSSDVEVDPAEIDSDGSRFEDVDDEEKAETKPAKRPRESDAMDTDAPKPSKAEKKKNKKMKAENGTAVPSGTDTKEGEKSGDSEKKPEVKEKKKKEKKEKEKESKSVELPGGLKIVDAKIGTGPMSKAGNKLKMRYIGKLDNGKVFDSNTKGKPFTFRLSGTNTSIGWDQGLVGMQAGGERVIVVPPQLGYGKKPSGPIPPNSRLTFECKLLEIN
ncbi:hypothetical protein CCMSSC00406_0002386 [Pleurotus cornucopiae]|uniref:Uncharacterized protein n=1 Tax=Pleurotus cornucopiae TaxID=5321 RepID=A0ACB7ITH4_PLECO|nr:hypothetical protein CCMSSC00406_0002386 [Pleurotus cornucopiae]